MRFGLDDGVPRTLHEIGSVYGVNRERIRTLLERAEVKLGADENFQALIPYMGTPTTACRAIHAAAGVLGSRLVRCRS
jgi:hypothetical protein